MTASGDRAMERAAVPEGSGARLALRMDGDYMEPLIKRGDTVGIAPGEKLTDGDVGVFIFRGEVLIRQYVEDSFGNIYLLVLNRARRELDITVPAASGEDVSCFGKLCVGKKPPLAGA